MNYETFKMKLKAMNLKINDFAILSNQKYNTVLSWNKKSFVPAWVEVFLILYETKIINEKALRERDNRIQKLIQTLSQ